MTYIINYIDYMQWLHMSSIVFLRTRYKDIAF